MGSGYVPPPPPLGQPSAYSPATAQPGSRKKIVWIIAATVLGALLVIVLFIGAIVGAIYGSLRSSEPYRHAVQVATRDPRAVSALGPQVKPGWMINGSINVRNDSGDADMSIPVQGTRHNGTIHVVAEKAKGVWTYQTLALSIGDGEEINLLQPGDTTQEK
jgi:hypothetical protein